MKPILVTSLALAALTLAAEARAQVVVNDPAGYPMRVISVSLTPGHVYEFRTDYTLTALPGAGSPDSVLSLRSGSGTSSPSLAGADGCTTPDGFRFGPSCFTYAEPGTGAAVSRTLYLRAWRTQTPGQTDVWMRDITTGTGAAFTKLTTTPVTFGGGVLNKSYSGSARLWMNTTHRPGASWLHTMWAAQDEWKVFRSQSLNGRTTATAKFDLPDRAAANFTGVRQVVYGTLFSSIGATRLVENDFHLAGADVDGDGLGQALEAALGTCDRTTQTMAGGVSCATLAGCASPGSDVCRSSLRDTDHDGLRDDLELFGHASDAMLQLARWGADPAHMDVFVELDVWDQDYDPANGCQGFEPATIHNLGAWSPTATTSRELDFFADFQRIFDQAPASLNPDGTPGIRFHFDVGVANPDPSSPLWGDWGGGNTCFASVPGGDECGYAEAFWNGSGCPANTFAPSRRWVFRYGVDGMGPGGQTSGSTAYVAGHTSHHVHEMGHMAKLSHSGPEGASGAWDHFANHRVHYPSRMNYAYQDVGGTDASDLATWDKMSFSSGTLGGIGFRTDSVLEICPLPGKNLSFLSLAGIATREVGGCWDADWNRNGVFEAGTTFDGTLGHWYSVARWSHIAPDRPPLSAAPSMSMQGNFLISAYTRPNGDLGHRLVLRADRDAECQVFPSGYGATPLHDAMVTGGAHPGCIRPGNEWTSSEWAEAVALSSARIREGATTVEGTVLVYAQGSQLRWAKVKPIAAAGATEVTFGFTGMGLIAGASISTAVGSREPALVRLPDSDALMLVFRDPSGALRQAVLPAGSDAWSAVNPVKLMNGDGSTTAISSATAVSMAVQNGETVLAATDPANQRIRTYRFERSGASTLETRWWLSETYLSQKTALRPTIVSARDLATPTLNALYVYYVELAGGHLRAVHFTAGSRTSVAATHTFWGEQKLATAPAALYDTRMVAANWPGTRVLRPLATGCSKHADCQSGNSGGKCELTIGLCIDDYGDRQATLELDPFAQGVEPGRYTDYDDWKGLKWGFCSALQDRLADAPAGTSELVPTAYNVADCGPRPSYLEP